MTEVKELKWISGYWRRIGAFIIDSILLGVVGLGLGLVLEDVFVDIGVWGRLFGFTIALLYFGVMNSEIGKGQTLGKKLLKLRVVNSENQSISLLNSFGRYSIIGIPFFLNGAQFPLEVLTSFWMYILSLLIFGGLFSIFYLYTFNRVTRQSLHDLAFKTYVVNVGVDKQTVENVWKPHLAIVGLLFITAAAVPVFTMNLVQQEPFSELLNGLKAISKNPSVNYALVSYGASSSSKGTTTFVSAQVFLKENDTKNVELSRDLAKTLSKNCNLVLDKDVISINLIHGYDIGITSKWNQHSYNFDPKNIDSNKTIPSSNCI